MSDTQEVIVDAEQIGHRMARCLNVNDAEGAVICELALIGLKWNTNSALEEWFPMSSDRLFRLERENAELRQKLTEWAREAQKDVESWASRRAWETGDLTTDLAKWKARAEGKS